jgi:thioredoxin 1
LSDTELSAGKPVAITEGDFQRVVLESPVPVLVDFWAPWCGPCRMVAPILEQLAAEYGERLRVVKLNVDESPELAQRWGVHSIPTLAVFSGGQQADRIVGALPKAALAQRLDRLVTRPAAAPVA